VAGPGDGVGVARGVEPACPLLGPVGGVVVAGGAGDPEVPVGPSDGDANADADGVAGPTAGSGPTSGEQPTSVVAASVAPSRVRSMTRP
ncbi:MAG TPA: hypothetical protein VGP00_00895, partial [Nocardioides sp.]|nr:hypothetical protein [Nocardioides sp.]